MLTVLIVLAVAAFVGTLVAAYNKCPLWIPVLLLCIAELLRVLPLGK